ncbi:MAG: tetratricopeptide repeat protein [Xenococcaceae cyanobacterium]
MEILHLDLKTIGDEYVELRYFWDNPNDYKSRRLPLTEIADLIQRAETDYYTYLPVDYAITGQKLYQWLDEPDRFLQQAINQHQREGIILAIAAAEKLDHLPWEVLHDRNGFLVQRLPAIIPVRWTAANTNKLSIEAKPENRALQVLFMATSPLEVEPVLDFEAEEGRILEATKRQPLALTVEESGCLTELGYLVEDYGKNYFDVLHLTGHATLTDGEPRFITETEIGEAYYASATDIATELEFQLPKLIFLSGCRTGQAGKEGAVPSMAEELLKSGAKVVLGWGEKVLDANATEAAAALYQGLSAGKKLTEAVAETYQTLIKNQARDWHLLRLYAAETFPGELVTPLRTRRRKPAPPPSVAIQFLDPAGKVKVPTRESFVGRRRQLQNCLRSLKPPSEMVGVLIHGMGGLGKSSLAARLCDRLPDFERIVWVGAVDEPSLVNRLTDKLDSKELRQTLQSDDEELRFRLRRVFQVLEEQGAKPFLLVLDDFEVNLEPRNGGYVMQPEAAMVLSALVWAINQTYAPHRIIITSRYDFEFTQSEYFYKQPLEALRGADLAKKCDRLSAFGGKSQVDEALQFQGKRLADGNPRLLEWLDKILLDSKVDRGAILKRLEGDPVELREQVLAESLLAQMDRSMGEMLSRLLVFELPVPREALAAVCAETIGNWEHQFNRAVALGLLEVSPDQSLRVPRILPVQLPEDGESLYKQGAEVLYRLWWEESKRLTEEQRLEIHRLALGGKQGEIAAKIADVVTARWNNSSRYREAVKTCQDTLEVVEDYRIFHNLAWSERFLGEVDKAIEHYQQALELCPPEDEQEKASILHNLAELYTQQGQVEEAIALYQQSLELKERIGDVRGKAATLHCMAIIYAQQGQVEEAIALYQQSLELNERIGDVRGKASTLHSMAVIYVQQGEVEEAITLFQQSLELTERIGDIRVKAATLHNLAIIYAQQGQVEEAIALYQQSLELDERTGDVGGKAATLHQMARIYAHQGEVEKAIALYQQSLELFEGIGNVGGKAATLYSLAEIYAQQEQVEKAIALYQQSLELFERISDVLDKATALSQTAAIKLKLGKLYVKQGHWYNGLRLLEESLAIYRQGDDLDLRADTIYQIARTHHLIGNLDKSRIYYRDALRLYEHTGKQYGIALCRTGLGRLMIRMGFIHESLDELEQAKQIYRQLGDQQGEDEVEEVVQLESRSINQKTRLARSKRLILKFCLSQFH